MKKILLILCSLITLVYSAQTIDWRNTYEPTRATAQKSHKKILLLIVSPTCQYCVQLLNGPMHDPEIIQTVNSNYEPLMLMNMEQLPAGIRAKGVPTIYKLSADGKPIGAPLIGLQETQVLKDWLNR
jgi:thioredoxin-related protein